MKKTMTKIFALVLVLAMVIGFVAMIPTQAASNVEIYANNVGFAEKLHMMYAIEAESIASYDNVVINLSDENGNSLGTATRTGNQTIKDVDYAIFTAQQGIAVQNIAENVYAKVMADGNVVAEGRRSVLEYLYSQLLTNESVTANQKAMYESLLSYAGALQTVLMNQSTPVACKDINNYSFVKVENGTIDGTYAAGMIEAGTTLSGLKCDLVAGDGQKIVWTVTKSGAANGTLKMTTEEVQEITVDKGVNLIISAEVETDTGATEGGYYQVTDINVIKAGGQFVIASSGSLKELGKTMSSGKFENPVTLTVADGKVQNADVSVWTIEAVNGGVALKINESNYLAYGSSTNFKTETTAYTWVVENGNEENSFFLTSSATTRGVIYRGGNYDLFGAYATSNDGGEYQRDLVFFKYSDGSIVEPEATEPSVEPSEPEVTEPSVEPSEPEVTEPSVEPSEPEVVEPKTVTMDIFASTGTMNGTASISWTSDGVTFTNRKASSSTAIRTSDSDHFRVYANSALDISANGKITKIVITCTSESYADVMKNSIGSAATASGSVVTVTLDGSSSSLELAAKMTAQTRLNKIEVTYIPE